MSESLSRPPQLRTTEQQGAPICPAGDAPPVWSIYMVRTRSGSLYTGISTDPERRLTQHQSGTGARALRGKGPLILAWRQEVGERAVALRLEYRLKQQSKASKERLVLNPDDWQALAQQWLLTSTRKTRASRQ